MRFFLILSGMLLLVLAGACTSADGAPPPPRHKARSGAAVNIDTNALLQQTVWKGQVLPAPTNSAASVVGELKMATELKMGPYLLRTEDPVLGVRIRDLGKGHKGTAVVLTGRMDPDCAAILVTEILELPAPRKPERK